MKIALVVHDCCRSVGHGRYVVELAERFSLEHEVHVFANSFDPQLSSRVHRHHVRSLRATALTTIFSFPVAAALQIRRGFDIVHAQGFCCPWFNVVTAHICNESWFQAQQALGGGAGWKGRIFRSLVTPLEKWVYRRTSPCQIIAISEKTRSELSSLYECRSPIHVIHHGVDLIGFSPNNRTSSRAELRDALSLAPDLPVALFVGDLRKGASTVIEALSDLPSLYLVLVSRSPVQQWKEQARRTGVLTRVRFCPPTKKISRYYACSDMLVFPTWNDSFGMVITEAMACGLPVITTRLAGAAELIVDNVNGLLLDRAGDSRELTRLIRKLLADPKLVVSIGSSARVTAERHSWDAVADRTLDVYRTALASHA